MSYKLTICITETLERLIEVEVDNIDCDPIEYVRQQYLDEEIILDANAAWLSLFLLILLIIVLMVEATVTMDTISSEDDIL